MMITDVRIIVDFKMFSVHFENCLWFNILQFVDDCKSREVQKRRKVARILTLHEIKHELELGQGALCVGGAKLIISM